MKRKLIFTLFIVAIVVTTMLAACAAPAPAPTTAPTAPAPTTQAPKVIELTFSDHDPPDSSPAVAIQAYGKYIEENSSGKVKVNVVIGGALLQESEAYPAVQSGVVDAASYVINRKEGFTINDVITLPFMGYPGQVKSTQIYWDLVKKFPEMEKEWKDTKYVVTALMPPTHLHFTKKVVKTPADIKGVKISAMEAIANETAAALGAVPIETPPTDLFVTINSGAVEGMLNHFPVAFVFGALDLLKTHTIMGAGGIYMAPMGVVWNKAKYDSLPADVKKVVDDAAKVYENVFFESDIGFQKMTEGICRDRGDTFVELTDAQVKDWYNLVKGPLHDRWIADAKAKGLPGQEIYNETLKLIQQYK